MGDGGGVFICVKNNIACLELWVDDDFEILAIEVKGSDPSYTWEIIGTYRARNEGIGFIELLASRSAFLGNSIKRSIIGGDLNLPQVNWKGIVDSASAAQTSINRLVWDNGYTHVVDKPTREDSVLDVYLVRPDSTLISCDKVQGISDHCGVLLEVGWVEESLETHEKRLIPMYNKTNVLGLHNFLRDKLPTWINNGSCVEDMDKIQGHSF